MIGLAGEGRLPPRHAPVGGMATGQGGVGQPEPDAADICHRADVSPSPPTLGVRTGGLAAYPRYRSEEEQAAVLRYYLAGIGAVRREGLAG